MSAMSSPQQARQDRQIRVFISSTFKDMKEERDYLVKFTFPQLRKLCESRGVVWGEVDLRWGVPDEAVAEGKVLPICLEEIKRCRPYFIGLLGERYGWIPDAIPDEVIEREPWLAEHVHGRKSVTELEILHGVLNNPDMTEHAFFYFRDPGYLDRLPRGAKPSDFRSESKDDRERILALKDRIRHSGFPLHEDYPDPRAFGELVLRDFSDLINRLFPDVPVDPLDRDAADHEAFGQSRARVYVARQEDFNRLDEHASGDGPPLVILGDSGGGKSALLANWAIRHREGRSSDLLIMHFIGASPYSADWSAMLRRIMVELKRSFHILQDIPESPDELRISFAEWLHIAGQKGHIVLILDGLNQLDDQDGAPDLVWLPTAIPTNIRLILSTLSGRSLTELRKRGWPTLTVGPFSPQERRQFIGLYLRQHTKSLCPARTERIATARQSENPLYLQTLLEELRLFGEHERLDERIGYYLEAATVPELFEKVLARYEEDYEHDRPGLVRDAMTAIWAARRGLSEAELLQLLGRESARYSPWWSRVCAWLRVGGGGTLASLPSASWSPLCLAAEQSIISRSGLLIFSHAYFREAVKKRYLAGEQAAPQAHSRLADYFRGRPLSTRRVEELPWQLVKIQAWKGLYDVFLDPAFFTLAWDEYQSDVIGYWTQLEGQTTLRVANACAEMLKNGGANWGVIFRMTQLLEIRGETQGVAVAWQLLADQFREVDDKANLQAAIGNQGLCLLRLGEFDAALHLFEEQERIAESIGHNAGLVNAMTGRAAALRGLRRPEAFQEAVQAVEEVRNNRPGTYADPSHLGAQAVALVDGGDLLAAMAKFRELEHMLRTRGSKHELATCLGNMGLTAQQLGDPQSAKSYADEAAVLASEFGLPRERLQALEVQAAVAAGQKDWETALSLYREQEVLCEQLGNMRQALVSLMFQAGILAEQYGRHAEALAPAEKAFQIAHEVAPDQVGEIWRNIVAIRRRI